MFTVLAVGAHPDDIELGCSASLLRHKKDGAKIYLLVLTRGEASGNPEIREEECLRCSKEMGAEDCFFGDLEDTKIDDSVKTIMAIEKIINQVNPDIIYTHSPKDTHQDHRNTANATLSAGRYMKKIFLYESPTTVRDFIPQIFIEITEEFEQKKEIVRSFVSQNTKRWWSKASKEALALEGLAAYRGFQVGVDFAEAFEVAKLVVTCDELSYYVSGANKSKKE